MQGYSSEDISKIKKHITVDMLSADEFIKLLESGWVIYDTRATDDENIKVLTLVKVNHSAQ